MQSRTRFRIRLAAGVALLLTLGLLVSVWRSFARRGGTLPVGKGIPAIRLGERHGLILASDGSLWAWGSDFLGWPVLGLGTGTNHSTTLRRVGSETNWVRISAGISHNLAIKSDGTLWTWGESVQGARSPPRAISVPTQAAPGNDWQEVAAGGIHSVAIKKDGTLWGWGNNWAGSVGIASTNGSPAPVQVGTATNWDRVWASILESVGLQSDGSLWYWGDNLNPAFAQDAGRITAPTRVNADTNWVDVGFGVNTVFAIKADGTLWVWGRQAHVYTGGTNLSLNTIPARVGTNSDWQSFSACSGWWCQGLIKKDGSLWLMDASGGGPNGPQAPYQPVRFRRVPYQQDYVAYAGGAVHTQGPGGHGAIGVVLRANGEVWTWGMVLGDPPSLKGDAQVLAARFGRILGFGVTPPPVPPVFREKPWRLGND